MNTSMEEIRFQYETDFQLEQEAHYRKWITAVIYSEDKRPGAINFIFTDDKYLHKLNLKYLGHDTYTDIITFDYTEKDEVSGDVFISVERVIENAQELKVVFREEINRVMAHGVLHMLGYGDKTEEQTKMMRIKETEKMLLFDVEQN
jgi:probable rRNA maturation factor